MKNSDIIVYYERSIGCTVQLLQGMKFNDIVGSTRKGDAAIAFVWALCWINIMLAVIILLGGIIGANWWAVWNCIGIVAVTSMVMNFCAFIVVQRNEKPNVVKKLERLAVELGYNSLCEDFLSREIDSLEKEVKTQLQTLMMNLQGQKLGPEDFGKPIRKVLHRKFNLFKEFNLHKYSDWNDIKEEIGRESANPLSDSNLGVD